MEAVREAAVEDAQRFVELRDEFRTALAGHRGGSLALRPTLDPLPELLGDGSHLVLMATLDSVVTGYAHGHVIDPEGHPRRGVVDACFVEPEARGVGLGRLLMDEMLAWLRGQGCTGVDGLALPGDRTAKNFYEAAGFKARVLTMYRPLE